MPATGIVRAVAVADGISSLPVVGIYTIVPLKISLTPAAVSLGASQSQTFVATIAGASNRSVVWSLTPAVGTISTAGVYIAPASISNSQTVTVTAKSAADPSVLARSTITLNPPVTVAITPGSVSLTASQTQLFSATVANTTNTSVIWSLSPAVGSISTAGLYTAPASIPGAESVTVTATPGASSSAPSIATVILTPPNATYYLSPTGSDSNNDKSSSASWLTPNHAVNCRDVIVAAAGAPPMPPQISQAESGE